MFHSEPAQKQESGGTGALGERFTRRWEHFGLPDELGLRGFGPDMAAAFEEAAKALTAALTPLETVKPYEAWELGCRAPGHDALLVDWLNELIHLMKSEGVLFSNFHIEIEGDRLWATAWGEAIGPDHALPGLMPRCATYTDLLVARRADGSWKAQCVVEL